MDSSNRVIPFGKPTKHVLYYLDPNIHFTNHGSYGTSPRWILDRKRELQLEMERCPDRWFRTTSFRKWQESIEAMANFLKVDKSNVLLFENATEAIGTVLKWVEFNGCRDAILTTRINYQSVLNAIDYTAKYRFDNNNRVNIVMVDVRFPIASVDELVEQFDKTCREIIEANKWRLRLAVVDHVASSTGIVYPIEKISKLIRTRAGPECIILIDGAHGIGQIELDFSPETFHADFYVSNLHKWFLSPRSCAFLYTSNKNYFDYRFQPAYISHGYPAGPEHSVSYNHYQRGTMDKTSIFVVPDCIEFYQTYLGGLNRIKEYTRPLMERVISMLESEWGTTRLQVPDEMVAPFLRVIKLPELRSFRLTEENKSEWAWIEAALMKHLLDKFNVVAFVSVIYGELYCRISCFVYHSFEDYVALKDAILRLKNGE